MAKQHSIELMFPIKEINPCSDLGLKFERLGLSPSYQRLIVDLELLNADNQSLFSLDANLDTGAILSLLPKPLLRYYPELPTVSHTLWGIVDSPKCLIKAEIGLILIQIKDVKGTKSPPFQIPVAFVDLDPSPHLLGMKGLIDKANVIIKTTQKTFSLTFEE